jgi:pilus assembly protein CpaB
VRVDEVVGVAGFALPGHKMDVMVHTTVDDQKRGQGAPLSKIVLERILVLAVAQEASRDETRPKVVNAVTWRSRRRRPSCWTWRAAWAYARAAQPRGPRPGRHRRHRQGRPLRGHAVRPVAAPAAHTAAPVRAARPAAAGAKPAMPSSSAMQAMHAAHHGARPARRPMPPRMPPHPPSRPRRRRAWR